MTYVDTRKTHGPSRHVASTLPQNWQLDEVYAEQVRDEIRRCLRDDTLNYAEIAIRVGVSDRTVQRIATREDLCRTVRRV